jgi:hypothetical protein
MNPATDWIDQARGLLDMIKQGVASPSDGTEHGGDCRWCPVCQAAAVVRGERPEVTAALADVLTSAAAALRTLAETDRPAAPQPEGKPTQRRGDGLADPPPVVQRIEIA